MLVTNEYCFITQILVIIRGRGHERILEYTGTESPGTRNKNILKSVFLIHVYLLPLTRVLIEIYFKI